MKKHWKDGESFWESCQNGNDEKVWCPESEMFEWKPLVKIKHLRMRGKVILELKIVGGFQNCFPNWNVCTRDNVSSTENTKCINLVWHFANLLIWFRHVHPISKYFPESFTGFSKLTNIFRNQVSQIVSTYRQIHSKDLWTSIVSQLNWKCDKFLFNSRNILKYERLRNKLTFTVKIFRLTEII